MDDGFACVVEVVGREARRGDGDRRLGFARGWGVDPGRARGWFAVVREVFLARFGCGGLIDSEALDGAAAVIDVDQGAAEGAGDDVVPAAGAKLIARLEASDVEAVAGAGEGDVEQAVQLFEFVVAQG